MGERICSIDDCERPTVARGWCDKHYRRWKRHGDPASLPPRQLPPQNFPRTIGCKVDGCDEKHSAKGYCRRHYANASYHADVEASRAAQRARRDDPAVAADNRARAKAWRQANPERSKSLQKQWRDQRKEELKAKRRAYRDANRDTIRALNNRRKALQRNVEVNDLTSVQWVAIVASYGGRCVYCGCTPEQITMDHVIPLSKGGNHTASNVVPACGSCNSAKSDGPAPPFVIEPAA